MEMAGELIYPNYNSCLFIQFVAYFEFYVPRVIIFTDPEGYASLPPINPAYRTWTREDERIADQF
jgi:hypothetical protein